MRIIDKKKDYYDYLVGKFGIDTDIIFDRRNFTMLKDDWNFQHINDKEWYGFYSYPMRINVGIGNKLYHFIIKKKGQKAELNPWLNTPAVGERKKGLPITRVAISSNFGRDTIIDNVLFQGTFIPSLVSPEEAYTAIYEYLSSMKDIDIIDSRTDKEKLLSAGFDSKTSFRKM